MKYEISYNVCPDNGPAFITTYTIYAQDVSQAIFMTGQWCERNHPEGAKIGKLIAVIAHDAPITIYRQSSDLGNVGAYRALPPGPGGGD